MMKLCGFAIIGAVSFFLLSVAGWSGAKSINAAVFTVIFGAAMMKLEGGADTLGGLFTEPLINDAASVILRAVGIVFIAEATSETCRSLGAESSAVGIDFACRAELFVLVLPLFEQILTLSVSLL